MFTFLIDNIFLYFSIFHSQRLVKNSKSPKIWPRKVALSDVFEYSFSLNVYQVKQSIQWSLPFFHFFAQSVQLMSHWISSEWCFVVNGQFIHKKLRINLLPVIVWKHRPNWIFDFVVVLFYILHVMRLKFFF